MNKLTPAQLEVVIDAIAYYETILEDEIQQGIPAGRRLRSLNLAAKKLLSNKCTNVRSS